MKNLNDNGKGLLVFLFKVAVGILLLVDPIRFTGSILLIFGVLAVAYGIVKAILYFFRPPLDAAKEQGLSKGLLCLTIGLFCICRAEWILASFSTTLILLYGIAMGITGIFELQWTVDMLRLKRNGWIPQAISAAFALLVGAILLMNPFQSAELLWKFAGISIIVSGIPDVLVPFLKKKNKPAPTEPIE